MLIKVHTSLFFLLIFTPSFIIEVSKAAFRPSTFTSSGYSHSQEQCFYSNRITSLDKMYLLSNFGLNRHCEFVSKIGNVLVRFKWFPMNSCKVCQLKFHDQLIFELFVLISNACYNCFLTRGSYFYFRSWLKPLTAFKCAILFLRCSEKLFFFMTLVPVTFGQPGL